MAAEAPRPEDAFGISGHSCLRTCLVVFFFSFFSLCLSLSPVSYPYHSQVSSTFHSRTFPLDFHISLHHSFHSCFVTSVLTTYQYLDLIAVPTQQNLSNTEQRLRTYASPLFIHSVALCKVIGIVLRLNRIIIDIRWIIPATVVLKCGH